MRPSDAAGLGQLIQAHPDWSVDVTAPRRGTWIDVSAISGLVTVDRVSGVAHLRGATTWGDAEAAVQRQGSTLGPIPGWLASARIMDSFAANDRLRPSPRYGQLTDAALAIRAVLSSGKITRSTVTPRRATGPDLARAVVGAGHRAGVVTDVHLRVWAKPAEAADRAVAYRTWRAGVAGALAILAAGVEPAWWRLSRVDRQILLVARLEADNRDALIALANRFDNACGGQPSATTADPAADTTPRRLAEVCAPSALSDALRGRPGAEVWDIRREGVGIFLPGVRRPFVDAEWKALAETFFAALEGP